MDLIPTLDYVILTALLLLAFSSLGFGLLRIWRRIRVGRPVEAGDATGAATPLGPVNGSALLFRGMLASRLFKRPVSGLAHALVLFGSIVLILGHAVYPLTFLGVPLFEGRIGFWFMGLGRDLAGVAVLLGVIFFLLRRLFPPVRLATPKNRRGFVYMELLLLAALLAGFGAETFRIAYSGAHEGKFVGNLLASLLGESQGSFAAFHYSWWIHGLIGLSFMALIAHSPVVHILLGPINSALASARRGVQLKPVDFSALEDETAGEIPALGASKLVDFDRKSLLDFATCLWCGRCDEVCPAVQTGKALSPKGVIATLSEYLSEEKFADDSLVDAIGMQAVFDCVTCAACMEACPVSIAQPQSIQEIRRHFVMERSELPEVMGHANKNLEARQHPFVGTAASPDDWRRDLEVPLFEKGKTEYLLWIGCSITYEERAQQIARAMVRILEAAGVSFGILEQARCTGDPAKQMGNELLFVELAQQNIDDFEARGIHKIITMCAHCFNSFTRYYPELEARYEVIPHAVLIKQLIDAGKLQLSGSGERITFHDPCYLSRHNDIESEARDVIAALGELVEMPRNRKQSFCCGAGGANYWGGEGGERINDVRSREALDTGAEKIATSCPFCLLMLTEGVSKHSQERRVFDIAELVEQRRDRAGE
jgi:Fe-S oxidoreductase/nitrate reductase gamma subunit